VKNNTKNDKIPTFLMRIFGCELCWWLLFGLKFRVGKFFLSPVFLSEKEFSAFSGIIEFEGGPPVRWCNVCS
jgi:hypothetical protein